MKKLTYILAAFVAAATLAVSCSKVLDEQPRTFFEPGFFQTEAGVEGGLTALYASLRYFYGQAYYYNINTTGTDEATYGQSADNNFKDADLSGAGSLNATSSRSDVLWNTVFPYINTASGIIENAEQVGLSNALIAEAKFFRGWYYFQLVQTFGGVPLDLGSGELAFNSTPVRTSVRNTVPEVYQAIFSDLGAAVNDLPENPRITGGVTKNVARLVLAKAYLTFGWWLENPKGIATYPQCDRKDLGGHDANWFYTQALSVCETAIANPGPYGLCTTFREVSLAQNDRNKEILLWADHTEKSEQYNGASLGYSGGSAPDNFSGWMMNWNHGTVNIDGTGCIQREASQEVGRPWTRMAPTHEAIKVFTSQDITKDSRFDGTFTTGYYGNWEKAGISRESVPGANGLIIPMGGRVISFIPEVLPDIKYPDAQSNKDGANVGAGTVPGRADYVFDLNGISRIAYPSLWKLGCYRTDYDKASQLGSPNAASTRPYNVLKFSDFYLTAAEAAFKLGDNTKARNNILVLRRRAGVWSYSNYERAEYKASFSDELAASTPATITLDYILDERMREFYGEGFRWFDLVRTQTWKERAGTYTISGSNWGAHKPETVTRTIEDYMYLRPIPQGQLNGMDMSDAEKAAYQNPGYTVQ
ncbi:MAG: RagB/SusD family nutrient uptake outer membrane protein [Bacteroidales bacterium]|nr:RagB/SusD family nutrient uptake outer membrane protein [Bacteroidales bacterium]